MEFSWKNCFRAGISLFLLYLCIHYWDAVAGFGLTFYKVAWPLVLGAMMAYVVDILMSFLERKYDRLFGSTNSAKRGKKGGEIPQKLKRPLCMVLSYLLIVLVIVFSFSMVIPELVRAINLLIAGVPHAIDLFIQNETVKKYLPEITAYLDNVNWTQLGKQIFNSLTDGINIIANGAVSAVASITTNVINFVLAFIFSLYLLLGKERLREQIQAIGERYLPQKLLGAVYHILHVLNGNFHSFIVGQCTEAVIIGCLCIIGMFICQFPYAVMVGILVGVSALVPVAGAYIGAIVGALLMLTISPLKALLFIVFIIVLQQLEGNLIYPKVVGGSIGLPALWVLAAITIGGGLAGIAGMLLGVPLFASFYQLLKEDVRSGGRKRNRR